MGCVSSRGSAADDEPPSAAVTDMKGLALADRILAAYRTRDSEVQGLTLFEYAALEVDMGLPLSSPRAVKQRIIDSGGVLHEGLSREAVSDLLDSSEDIRRRARAALVQRLSEGPPGGLTGLQQPARTRTTVRRGHLRPTHALCMTVGGQNGEIPHCPDHRVPLVFETRQCSDAAAGSLGHSTHASPASLTFTIGSPGGGGGGGSRRVDVWRCGVCSCYSCGAHWRCPIRGTCSVICCTLCCPFAEKREASHRVLAARDVMRRAAAAADRDGAPSTEAANPSPKASPEAHGAAVPPPPPPDIAVHPTTPGDKAVG